MAQKPIAEKGKIEDQRLDDFATDCMITYGSYVVENRALPDFRDGLKPIYRKVMWAMNDLGLKNSGATMKTSRIVGDTIGKYSPHGDIPVHNAINTLVNMSEPLVHGQGNWGKLNTPQAAMRYTEAKFSEYAEKIFLNKDYLNITSMMKNYDGSTKEPIVLPALLPNILINGIVGIAVGVITGVPPYEIEGIKELLIKQITKNKITPSDCVKHLRVKYPYGGKVITTDEEMEEFYTTGEGKIKISPTFKIDGNIMDLDTFPPYFSMVNAKEKLTGVSKKKTGKTPPGVDEVYRADDISGKKTGYKFRVTLKNNIPITERRKIFEKCLDKLSDSINLRMNFTHRISEDEVKFVQFNMPGFFKAWTEWRVELEVKCQNYIIGDLKKDLRYQELLLLACINLDIIFKVLKANEENLDGRLSKALKISLDDAQIVLGMPVRRLSKLSQEEIKKVIAKKKEEIKSAVYYRDHPKEKILNDLKH